MRLGYSVGSSVPEDRSPNEAVTELLSRAETARDAGFEYVEIGDHHVMAGVENRPDGYLQNVPLASRLTQVFDHVAVLFLLPLYNPVLVSEQVGTLSALVDRLDLWSGIGWRRAEYDALGVPFANRGARLEEHVSVLKRLWNEDEVTYDGEFYQVEDVSVNPKADIGRYCFGGSVEPAVRRAGRMGDAWVVSPGEPPENIEPRVDWFRESGDGDVIIRRDVLALPDDADAKRRANAILTDGYRGWPQDATCTLAGNAEALAAEFQTLRRLGVDEVVVRPMEKAQAETTLREVAHARDLMS